MSVCVYTEKRQACGCVYFLCVYVVIHVSTLSHEACVHVCGCTYLREAVVGHACSQSCNQIEQCQCGSEGMCVPVSSVM